MDSARIKELVIAHGSFRKAAPYIQRHRVIPDEVHDAMQSLLRMRASAHMKAIERARMVRDYHAA